MAGLPLLIRAFVLAVLITSHASSASNGADDDEYYQGDYESNGSGDDQLATADIRAKEAMNNSDTANSVAPRCVGTPDVPGATLMSTYRHKSARGMAFDDIDIEALAVNDENPNYDVENTSDNEGNAKILIFKKSQQPSTRVVSLFLVVCLSDGHWQTLPISVQIPASPVNNFATNHSTLRPRTSTLTTRSLATATSTTTAVTHPGTNSTTQSATTTTSTTSTASSTTTSLKASSTTSKLPTSTDYDEYEVEETTTTTTTTTTVAALTRPLRRRRRRTTTLKTTSVGTTPSDYYEDGTTSSTARQNSPTTSLHSSTLTTTTTVHSSTTTTTTTAKTSTTTTADDTDSLGTTRRAAHLGLRAEFSPSQFVTSSSSFSTTMKHSPFWPGSTISASTTTTSRRPLWPLRTRRRSTTTQPSTQSTLLSSVGGTPSSTTSPMAATSTVAASATSVTARRRLTPLSRINGTTTTTTQAGQTVSKIAYSSTGPRMALATPVIAMSGGFRGPQCLPGVEPTHDSCLEDSSLLIETVPFDINEPLAMHNWWRRNVQPKPKNLTELVWDDDLALTAERYAATCPLTYSNPAHRALLSWNYGVIQVGQNICWSKRDDMSWVTCIDNWALESKNWRYGVGPTKLGAVVTHFTQLVWQDTLALGCGKAHCYSQDFAFVLVCNYGPAGDNVGTLVMPNIQRPYVAADDSLSA